MKRNADAQLNACDSAMYRGVAISAKEKKKKKEVEKKKNKHTHTHTHTKRPSQDRGKGEATNDGAMRRLSANSENMEAYV